jgi:hypothetical protein
MGGLTSISGAVKDQASSLGGKLGSILGVSKSSDKHVEKISWNTDPESPLNKLATLLGISPQQANVMMAGGPMGAKFDQLMKMGMSREEAIQELLKEAKRARAESRVGRTPGVMVGTGGGLIIGQDYWGDLFNDLMSGSYA